MADRYWNARGGSHSDGGAFVYRVRGEGRRRQLVCESKFGDRVRAAAAHVHQRPEETPVEALRRLPRREAIRQLTLLRDRPAVRNATRQACLVALADRALEQLFGDTPRFGRAANGDGRLLTWETRRALEPPARPDEPLYLNARGFPPEGEESAARWLVRAHRAGWRRLVVFGCEGHRFLGCGLGPATQGTRIDVYGSPGDYLGSGLDGAEIHVHGDGQDQLGQIMASGKLVVHGSVGQTFLYGAKGGVCHVRGNAAGRPLINTVGNIRAVINGTALDYAAESFMAGEETGGGFLLLNGLRFDAQGRLEHLADRYPGGNLFSLASGGACYLLDPARTTGEDQLNEARFADFTAADWALLSPYLAENERLFGIRPADLLGDLPPQQAYRKVVASGALLLPSHE